MSLNGWPFNNAAADGRNFTAQPFQNTRVAMMMPRAKFTFLIEFQINVFALQTGVAQTDLGRYIQNGKIYFNLKSIDLPKISFKTEKIRAYNKERILTTKLEYPPCSMVFQDDSTSMTASLIKEYIAFYHETGDIGTDVASGQSRLRDDAKFSNSDQLFDGTDMRSESDKRPSLGMKLREDPNRNFFDGITVYNLGTEPDSINIYYFYHPTFNNIDSDVLDYEERTVKNGFTFNFEYESFYFTVGQPRNPNVASALAHFDPDATVTPTPSQGHVFMSTVGRSGDGGDLPKGINSNLEQGNQNAANQQIDPQTRQPVFDPNNPDQQLQDIIRSTASDRGELSGVKSSTAADENPVQDQPGSTIPPTESGTLRDALKSIQPTFATFTPQNAETAADSVARSANLPQGLSSDSLNRAIDAANEAQKSLDSDRISGNALQEQIDARQLQINKLRVEIDLHDALLQEQAQRMTTTPSEATNNASDNTKALLGQ